MIMWSVKFLKDIDIDYNSCALLFLTVPNEKNETKKLICTVRIHIKLKFQNHTWFIASKMLKLVAFKNRSPCVVTPLIPITGKIKKVFATRFMRHNLFDPPETKFWGIPKNTISDSK